MNRRLERLAISSLRLPGDIPERMKKPHVVELAESIRELGLIEPVVVELGTLRLVAGRDRVAACRVLGLDQIEATLVTGDEFALEKMEIVENLHRRHDDKAALQVQYLDLVRKERLTRRGYGSRDPEVSASEEQGKPAHRARSEEREVREEAARDLGTTANALRLAERRVRETEETPQLEPAPPCIDTLGLTSDELPAVLDNARLVLDCLDKASKYVSAALQSLLALKDEAVFAPSALEQLREEAAAVRYSIGQARPGLACPYCKLTRLRHGCGGCAGVGWVSEGARSFVPAELLVPGEDAVVMVDRKPAKVSDLERTEVADADDGLLF